MRDSMLTAQVGDEIYGDDPTTNQLTRTVADMLGKEQALFVPSCTMANLISLMIIAPDQGDSVIIGDMSHDEPYCSLREREYVSIWWNLFNENFPLYCPTLLMPLSISMQ
jgi:7-keto-8-aminopelargonate synthetase-like enzyme